MEGVVCVHVRFRQAAAPQREHILKLDSVWWDPGGDRGDVARQIFVAEDAVEEGSLEVVGELWIGAPAVQVPRNLECVVPARRIAGPAAAQ